MTTSVQADLRVMSSCTIVATAGLMVGYVMSLGISGGVTSRDSLLKKFFPVEYVNKHKAKENNYCKYNNQYMQLFASSPYLAAAVSCFIASKICSKFGRKITIQLASLFCLIGAVLSAAAINLIMLILGMLCLGIGLGFGNLAVPLFISEITPATSRGGYNIVFQGLVTYGLLIPIFISAFTSNVSYGWRISFGGAAIPAIGLGVGSFFIVETPTSLIERGMKVKGYQTLRKIRSGDDVDKEFQEIVVAVEMWPRVVYAANLIFIKHH